MNIKNPKANYQESVMVLNYRKKPAVWESGIVCGLKYENSFGKFSWSYDVKLNRRNTKGEPIFLYVGDEDLTTKPDKESER